VFGVFVACFDVSRAHSVSPFFTECVFVSSVGYSVPANEALKNMKHKNPSAIEIAEHMKFVRNEDGSFTKKSRGVTYHIRASEDIACRWHLFVNNEANDFGSLLWCLLSSDVVQNALSGQRTKRS